MRLGSRREEVQPATPLPPPPRNRVSPASALPDGVWARWDKPRLRRLVPVSQLSTLNSQLSRTSVHRDPATAGRRFIPLLLGDCALPDTLRRYKVVDFREESEAALRKFRSPVRLLAELKTDEH